MVSTGAGVDNGMVIAGLCGTTIEGGGNGMEIAGFGGMMIVGLGGITRAGLGAGLDAGFAGAGWWSSGRNPAA